MTGPGPAASDVTDIGAVRRWWLGARPRTLPAAVVPVVVATAAAHARGVPTRAAGSVGWAAHGAGAVPRVDPWWCAAGALVVALAIQVGTNYANDYADGVRGTDDARVGPVRLTASGLAAPAAVRGAALASFAVAGVAGLGLAWATSWWLVPVGAACLLAGWFYTGGPRPYGYAGLGEVFVFVFFGLVATVGTWYVQTGRLGPAAIWWAATAVGLLATGLLLANNLRDIATDAVSGKRTLAVRIGRRAGGWCYAACALVPFGAAVVAAALGLAGVADIPAPGWLLLPLAALPLAAAPVRLATGDAEGRALLPVLAATGRLQLAYGGLLAVALWLALPRVLP